MQHVYLSDIEEHPKSGIPLRDFVGLSDAQIQTKVKEILAKHSQPTSPKKAFTAIGELTDDDKATFDISLGDNTDGSLYYDHIAKPTTIKGQVYTGYYAFPNNSDGNETSSLITSVGKDTIAAFDKPHTKGLVTMEPKD